MMVGAVFLPQAVLEHGAVERPQKPEAPLLHPARRTIPS